jgi:hypothetical protein
VNNLTNKNYHTPEQERDSSRKWRKTHHSKMLENGRVYMKRERDKLLNLLGNKCANPYDLPHYSWMEEPKMLHIDHINGGGNKERKSLNTSSSGYYRFVIRKILSGSKEYQLLCPACNWRKRYEKS